MVCSDFKVVMRKVKVCRKPCKVGKTRSGKGGRCKAASRKKYVRSAAAKERAKSKRRSKRSDLPSVSKDEAGDNRFYRSIIRAQKRNSQAR